MKAAENTKDFSNTHKWIIAALMIMAIIGSTAYIMPVRETDYSRKQTERKQTEIVQVANPNLFANSQTPAIASPAIDNSGASVYLDLAGVSDTLFNADESLKQVQKQLVEIAVNGKFLVTELNNFREADASRANADLAAQLAQFMPPTSMAQPLTQNVTRDEISNIEQWNRVMAKFESATGIPQHEIEALMRD